MFKRDLNKLLAVALLAIASAGASAQVPSWIEDCGFAASDPVTNQLFFDCVLWFCPPLLMGPAVPPSEEVDSDCAGAVFEIRTAKGGYRYTWTYEADSLSEARRYGLRYCRSKRQGGCTEVIVVRHAAAGYRPKSGGRGHWAQGADKPTAMDIAKARCDSAGNGPCILVGVFENSR